jgi:hypothetical protein
VAGVSVPAVVGQAVTAVRRRDGVIAGVVVVVTAASRLSGRSLTVKRTLSNGHTRANNH